VLDEVELGTELGHAGLDRRVVEGGAAVGEGLEQPIAQRVGLGDRQLEHHDLPLGLDHCRPVRVPVLLHALLRVRLP